MQQHLYSIGDILNRPNIRLNRQPCHLMVRFEVDAAGFTTEPSDAAVPEERVVMIGGVVHPGQHVLE